MGELLKWAGRIGPAANRLGEVWEDTIAKAPGVDNNPYGEIAASLIIGKISDSLEPWLGQKPEPFRFELTRRAEQLGLHQHDYWNIALQSGSIYEKRGRLYFHDGWSSKASAPQRERMERAFAIRAHEVYATAGSKISHKDYQFGNFDQQAIWRARSQSLGRFAAEMHDGKAAIRTMPHIPDILHNATQFTEHRLMGSSPIGAANSLFVDHLAEVGKRYTSANVDNVSDAIAFECIDFSNNLMKWDNTMIRSGLEFYHLERKPHFASRAISQVMMFNVLKAIESRDMGAVSLMNDIAYAVWAMTQQDSGRYKDDGMTSDLAWQWKVVDKSDQEIDYHRLRMDPEYSGDKFQALVNRVPGVQRLLR